MEGAFYYAGFNPGGKGVSGEAFHTIKMASCSKRIVGEHCFGDIGNRMIIKCPEITEDCANGTERRIMKPEAGAVLGAHNKSVLEKETEV